MKRTLLSLLIGLLATTSLTATAEASSPASLSPVPLQNEAVEIRNPLAALERGGNPDYTITRAPGLNHIFQNAKLGGPEEYMTLDEDFSSMGAAIVSSWIRVRFGE